MFQRVIKLGGSLLERSDVGALLERWLSKQKPARSIVIVGGGKLVDALRQFHHVHGLSEAQSHWLAIEGMTVTARMVFELLPGSIYMRSFQKLRDADSAHPIVFEVREFMRDVEAFLPGPCLPHSWAVTSDSIAARVASCLGADELVLLKSCLPCNLDSCSIGPPVLSAVTSGYVDPAFPTASTSLSRIRCVDCSDASFREITLSK